MRNTTASKIMLGIASLLFMWGIVQNWLFEAETVFQEQSLLLSSIKWLLAAIFVAITSWANE